METYWTTFEATWGAWEDEEGSKGVKARNGRRHCRQRGCSLLAGRATVYDKWQCLEAANKMLLQ